MIVHRAYRDIQRCKEKYGEAWKEYERRVPYLFIPVSDTLLCPRMTIKWLTNMSVVCNLKVPAIRRGFLFRLLC